MGLGDSNAKITIAEIVVQWFLWQERNDKAILVAAPTEVRGPVSLCKPQCIAFSWWFQSTLKPAQFVSEFMGPL